MLSEISDRGVAEHPASGQMLTLTVSLAWPPLYVRQSRGLKQSPRMETLVSSDAKHKRLCSGRIFSREVTDNEIARGAYCLVSRDRLRGRLRIPIQLETAMHAPYHEIEPGQHLIRRGNMHSTIVYRRLSSRFG